MPSLATEITDLHRLIRTTVDRGSELASRCCCWLTDDRSERNYRQQLVRFTRLGGVVGSVIVERPPTRGELYDQQQEAERGSLLAASCVLRSTQCCVQLSTLPSGRMTREISYVKNPAMRSYLRARKVGDLGLCYTRARCRYPKLVKVLHSLLVQPGRPP